MRISRWRVIVGIFLILVGFLWLLNMLGIIHFNICIIGPILVIVAGIALLIRGDFIEWW